MRTYHKQSKAWLFAIARDVADRLKLRRQGTSLRIHLPNRVTYLDTNEWSTVIGDLGPNKPILEIWFSRFSGHPERKLWAGFRSMNRQPLISISKKGAGKLWPVRVITPGDIADKDFVLAKPLARSEFNAPVLEMYGAGRTYFGIYDLTKGNAKQVSDNFCACAAAFFEDVARALPHAGIEIEQSEQNEVFPQNENRKRVASHLQRERSRLLATECKIRDDYACQVCGMRYDKVYGELGREFAEAHHLIPLSKLRGEVKTRLDELRTVCANCHRMLHRMEGKPDDINKLKAIVRRR